MGRIKNRSIFNSRVNKARMKFSIIYKMDEKLFIRLQVLGASQDSL